jgi:hypothetical protein
VSSAHGSYGISSIVNLLTRPSDIDVFADADVLVDIAPGPVLCKLEPADQSFCCVSLGGPDVSPVATERG